MVFLYIVLGLLFTLAFIQALQSLSTTSKKFPPGPTPLPIIGNLHLLGKHPHRSLTTLAESHGPLMLLRLGFRNTVVISSAAMAKEVLQTHDVEFSGRPVLGAIQAQNHDQYSVAFLPPGSKWRGLRKLLNSYFFSLVNLDSNKTLRSQKISELIAYCTENSRTGDAVDVGRAAFRTTLNLLSNTIFSRDLTDPFSDSAKDFKELIWNCIMETGKPNLADLFPILNIIDPQGIHRRMTVYHGRLLEIFSGLIDERLEEQKLSDGTRDDVIDALLTTSKQSPKEIDRAQIEHTCLDIFLAGTDTTSSTVEWAMAEILRNSEIMTKAKTELQEVIGKGKLIEEADIPRLPYLECLVKETLRLHPPAPLLLPHKVEKDVQVKGYTVPENSLVFVNAWAIGREPDIWENPLEFKPERFLKSEVDMNGRNFELIPFGSGRRSCPGRTLATTMVHLMLGSLLNSFDWNLESGIEPIELDMEEKFGLALVKAQPLRAVPIPL